jgi:hypothetical protein
MHGIQEQASLAFSVKADGVQGCNAILGHHYGACQCTMSMP